MALRSAVAVGSAVPTGLWAWIDHDTYAYVDFMHATNGSGWKTDPRLAWLYQRLYSKAALHGLVREVIPDDKTFWLTWLACPQLINIKILRKHFTDHSWRNLAIVSQQYVQIALMLLRPRRHLRGLPNCAFNLGMLWLFRGFTNAVVPQRLIKSFLRITSNPIASFAIVSIMLFEVLSESWTITLAVATGKCSPNPLTWEPFLDAKDRNEDFLDEFGKFRNMNAEMIQEIGEVLADDTKKLPPELISKCWRLLAKVFAFN